jgi:hypothetical protein
MDECPINTNEENDKVFYVPLELVKDFEHVFEKIKKYKGKKESKSKSA